MLDVWTERNVYEKEFMNQLFKSLNSSESKSNRAEEISTHSKSQQQQQQQQSNNDTNDDNSNEQQQNIKKMISNFQVCLFSLHSLFFFVNVNLLWISFL